MSDEFYKKICGVKSVQPVLDTAKFFKTNGMHVEITNLIIPDLNDKKEDIEVDGTTLRNPRTIAKFYNEIKNKFELKHNIFKFYIFF